MSKLRLPPRLGPSDTLSSRPALVFRRVRPRDSFRTSSFVSESVYRIRPDLGVSCKVLCGGPGVWVKVPGVRDEKLPAVAVHTEAQVSGHGTLVFAPVR